jgi:cysteine desulfurase
VIYLDHNATTPLDPRVLEAMMPYFKEDWGNPSSPYRFASRARTAVEEARQRIAECSGCKTEEIVLTSSGTESDNLAIRGVARTHRSRGDHIVTTAIEHHAVLNTCRALEAEGFRVTYLPVDSAGAVDIQDVEKSLLPETILITVMHANNETGVIQPVQEIADLAKHRGILFHTDAVQTAGKIPQPLCTTGADLISFSGHKLYGPKGAAALFVREKTQLAPLLTGGLQERGLRAGTENVAGIVGFARAFSLAAESAEEEQVRLEKLRNNLESRVCSIIAGVKINGAESLRIPNTTNLSFESVDGESIVLGLDLHGICISTGSACSTGEPAPSHVLLAMGLSPNQAQGSIRISLGKATWEEDIDAAIQALSETVEKLRTISSV